MERIAFLTPKIGSIYSYLSKGTVDRGSDKRQKIWADDKHQLLINGIMHKEIDLKYFVWSPGIKMQPLSDSTCITRIKLVKRFGWTPAVQHSFIDFYNTKLQDDDLCFVTGKCSQVRKDMPIKFVILQTKPNLISGNDTSGFTFRGRFNTSNEVAGISYEVSQKSHNALKWLINRQGKDIDGRVVLVWGNDKLDYVDPLGSGARQ